MFQITVFGQAASILVELIQLDREVIMACDEESKLKTITGAFRFYGFPELVIARNAVVLAGDGNRFKALHENIRSFEMSVEWIKPEDVPEPKMQFIAIN